MFFLHVYTHTTYLPSPCGAQKVSEPVELDLEMVVSHHVSARNLTQVPYKSSQCFPPLFRLFSPYLDILEWTHMWDPDPYNE